MTILIRARELGVSRSGRRVIGPLSFALRAGEVTALVGPNGAGKTTLMRALAGLAAHEGDLLMHERPLRAWPPQQRARQIALVPQGREIVWNLSVAEVVALGRLPHHRPLAPADAADHAAIARALAAMDLLALAQRKATMLSGGETARVLIARALAQEAPILLADEPTAGLDPAHQIALMAEFRQLARGGGCIVVTLHDLGLAARYCDRVLLLKAGALVADTAPSAALSEDNLAEVYGITAFLARDEGGALLVPNGLYSPRHTTGPHV